jgi:hypothetical protein
MTEQEWLGCDNPDPMLEFLRTKASDRRLRLFAVACARQAFALESQLPDQLRQSLWQPWNPDGYALDMSLFHHAIDLAEAAADDQIDREEWNRLKKHLLGHPVTGCPAGWDLCAAAKPHLTPIAAFEFLALTAAFTCSIPLDPDAVAVLSSYARAALIFLQAGPAAAARQMSKNQGRVKDAQTVYTITFRRQRMEDGIERWIADTEVEQANGFFVLAAVSDAQATNAALLREIFGNPFRPVAFDPAWRTPSVAAIAQTIYTERRFADMPILADALEEAGCTKADLLDHCRGAGEHTLGCWALDLILGKE